MGRKFGCKDNRPRSRENYKGRKRGAVDQGIRDRFGYWLRYHKSDFEKLQVDSVLLGS